MQKGLNGERKLDLLLTSLPSDFSIIRDLSLTYLHTTIQIDTAVITQHAIFLIEVKNFSGTITFDTTLHQLIRSDGEIENGFKYPITQCENNLYVLRQWLENHNLSGLPIHYFIAIAEPSTIIKIDEPSSPVQNIIAHASEITLRLLRKNSDIANFSSGNVQLQTNIYHALRDEHRDFDIDIMHRYKIDPTHILPGVRCLNCNQLKMVKLKRKWKCPHCDIFIKSPHKQALREFHLLFTKSISLKQCIYWLQLDSRHIAKRILIASGYTYNRKHLIWMKKNSCGAIKRNVERLLRIRSDKTKCGAITTDSER